MFCKTREKKKEVLHSLCVHACVCTCMCMRIHAACVCVCVCVCVQQQLVHSVRMYYIHQTLHSSLEGVWEETPFSHTPRDTCRHTMCTHLLSNISKMYNQHEDQFGERIYYITCYQGYTKSHTHTHTHARMHAALTLTLSL